MQTSRFRQAREHGVAHPELRDNRQHTIGTRLVRVAACVHMKAASGQALIGDLAWATSGDAGYQRKQAKNEPGGS